MKSSKLLAAAAIACLLIGCADQEESMLPDAGSNSELETIVFQERNPAVPLTDYQSLMPHSETRAGGEVGMDDLVGRSYKLENYPFESGLNIGLPVIDRVKYTTANPNSYYSSPLNESNTRYRSFRGFSRYEEKTQYSQTVSSGVNLNFVIFKINTKSTYKTIFNTSNLQIEENVFGELNIKYLNKKYELIVPLSLRKDLVNYRAESFIKHLYYTTPDEVIQMYGGFVLSKFHSGGQAVALYSSHHKESTQTSSVQKENDLDVEIGLTIKEEGVSASDSSKLALVNDQSYSKKFSTVQFTLRTLGGAPTFSQFANPQNFFSSFIDLSGWCNSLTNSNNLSIVELPNGSLIPISEFIEEDNLKAAFHSYYQEGAKAQVNSIIEPYIELRRIDRNPFNEAWETSLVTRYGDRIVLRIATMRNTAVPKYSTQELSRVKQLFPNLRIVGMSSQAPRIIAPEGPVITDKNDFDISKMTKYKDIKTGKIYLLTSVLKNGKKLAYTLYDQHVINDYVFSNLVRGIPNDAKASVATIRSQYYLIAL